MSETQPPSTSDSYVTLPPPLTRPIVVTLKRKASAIPLDDLEQNSIVEGTES